MRIVLDQTLDDYRLFLKVKQLPQYSFEGRTAVVPDEYAERLGRAATVTPAVPYEPSPFLFDYQRDIAAMCIEKRRFCVFADCGLGKTLIFLEFAKHVRDVLPKDKCILIISPLMVIQQTLAEVKRWYDDTLPIRQVTTAELPGWLRKPDARIGITNFEALTHDVTRGQLGCLIVDESSMLKSHYGKWGQVILRLGAGLEWKYAGSGTPAPNDRIEYANHAMFMGAFPTVNAFLARYFVNRGQTQERWSLKPHALAPFYRSLSHWSIFLTNPATYGWHDNAEGIPPIHVHIDDVPMTQEQHRAVGQVTGELIPTHAGGIGTRSKLGQIAKGRYNGKAITTNKPAYIRKLVDSWPGEGTIIWCLYNAEQDLMELTFPEAASLRGYTPMWKRLLYIEWFCGRICHCELERRLACEPQKKTKCTCESITETTSTDGKSGHRKNKPNTIAHDANDMPPTAKGESFAEPKRNCGKPAIQQSAGRNGSNATALLLPNTTRCIKAKVDDALFVERNALGVARKTCTSIIATPRGKCEGCYVPIAITDSVNSQTTPTRSSEPLPICDCIKTRPLGRILISKPSVLGYGLNLQVATRQVFSGLQDSYESFYQAVKRSNRVGSTKPLNVHIPVTAAERPMVENVLRKAHRVTQDTEEQERIFHAHSKRR